MMFKNTHAKLKKIKIKQNDGKIKFRRALVIIKKSRRENIFKWIIFQKVYDTYNRIQEKKQIKWKWKKKNYEKLHKISRKKRPTEYTAH